jgi:hypothetical protein
MADPTHVLVERVHELLCVQRHLDLPRRSLLSLLSGLRASVLRSNNTSTTDVRYADDEVSSPEISMVELQ